MLSVCLTLLGAGGIAINQIGKVLVHMEPAFSEEKKITEKKIKSLMEYEITEGSSL